MAEKALFGKHELTETTLLTYAYFKEGKSFADFRAAIRETKRDRSLLPDDQKESLAKKFEEIVEIRSVLGRAVTKKLTSLAK